MFYIGNIAMHKLSTIVLKYLPEYSSNEKNYNVVFLEIPLLLNQITYTTMISLWIYFREKKEKSATETCNFF